MKVNVLLRHKVTHEQGELLEVIETGWYCVKLKSSKLVWDEVYQWQKI